METAASRVSYDCRKCPAYCCSIYERVQVTKRDVKRLAKHFGLSEQQAEKTHTKLWGKERVLRRKTDPVLGESCKFLDLEKRCCTIYDARPNACREYPGTQRCAYFDMLEFERNAQNDKTVMPLIQITFKDR